MIDFSFTKDIPESTGVYYVIDSDIYARFLSNPLQTSLDGLKEVFVKKGGDGLFYAAGQDINLNLQEFNSYVWSKRCDFS